MRAIQKQAVYIPHVSYHPDMVAFKQHNDATKQYRHAYRENGRQLMVPEAPGGGAEVIRRDEGRLLHVDAERDNSPHAHRYVNTDVVERSRLGRRVLSLAELEIDECEVHTLHRHQQGCERERAQDLCGVSRHWQGELH